MLELAGDTAMEDREATVSIALPLIPLNAAVTFVAPPVTLPCASPLVLTVATV